AYGHRRGPPRRARPAAAPPTANRPPRTRPCAVRGGEPHDHESSPGTAAELATTARHHDHRTRRLRNHGPAVRYHRAAHPGRRGQRGWIPAVGGDRRRETRGGKIAALGGA